METNWTPGNSPRVSFSDDDEMDMSVFGGGDEKKIKIGQPYVLTFAPKTGKAEIQVGGKCMQKFDYEGVEYGVLRRSKELYIFSIGTDDSDGSAVTIPMPEKIEAKRLQENEADAMKENIIKATGDPIASSIGYNAFKASLVPKSEKKSSQRPRKRKTKEAAAGHASKKPRTNDVPSIMDYIDAGFVTPKGVTIPPGCGQLLTRPDDEVKALDALLSAFGADPRQPTREKQLGGLYTLYTQGCSYGSERQYTLAENDPLVDALLEMRTMDRAKHEKIMSCLRTLYDNLNSL